MWRFLKGPKEAALVRIRWRLMDVGFVFWVWCGSISYSDSKY